LANPVFVKSAIDELLISGIVVVCAFKPHVINPLTVAANKTKLRLVLDLREINPLLVKEPYKFEDLTFASDYFRKNQFFTCFDLKSGYHHIDIFPEHQKFLGFAWEHQGKRSFYKFCALAFGLSTAGFIFSKVLRTLVRVWREKGIMVVLYLDDGLVISNSKLQSLKDAETVRTDLANAGLIVNEAKSVWCPTQCIKWLGFELDSLRNVFIIPADKLQGILGCVTSALLSRACLSAKDLAKVVGKLCALFHALGNLVYIMTKSSQMWIAKRSDWLSTGSLDQDTVGELVFWCENLHKVKAVSLEKPVPSFNRIAFSDASSTGCGAFIQGMANTILVQKWSYVESLKSSAWRELRAIHLFLSVHAVRLQNKEVLVYTDNQAIVSIVRKSSMVLELHLLAKAVFELCVENAISLTIRWIPRDLNSTADDLSKLKDRDDWGVDKKIFDLLQSKLGEKFTLDAFASTENAKCCKFFSKFWCLNSSGVNSFSFDWSSEFVWLVPPIKLVTKALRHAQFCNTSGVLIVPAWRSAAFWPHINNGMEWSAGLKLIYQYRNPSAFFVRGLEANDVFTDRPFLGSVLIFGFDFRVSVVCDISCFTIIVVSVYFHFCIHKTVM
jgi:hypothetical protein